MLRKRLKTLADAFKLDRPIRIVDVGANPLHDPPYQGLVAAGQTALVGFEPHKEAYENLKDLNSDHATFVNAAVGKDGDGTLHVYKSSSMSSLYPLDPPSLTYLKRFKRLLVTEEKHPVSLKSLDNLEEVPDIDFLKVDAQGAEFDILQGGEGKLANAQAVMVELRYYQLYTGEPTLGDVDNELRRQGFKLHKFLGPARVLMRSKYRDQLHQRNARSQMVDGDAIYIRNMEDISTWDDASLKRIALMAAGIWASHDMVLMLLEELENRGVISGKVAKSYIKHLPETMLADDGHYEKAAE